METEININQKGENASSCDYDEVIEIKDSPSPVKEVEEVKLNFAQEESFTEKVVHVVQDEPIDLTFGKSELFNNRNTEIKANDSESDSLRDNVKVSFSDVSFYPTISKRGKRKLEVQGALDNPYGFGGGVGSQVYMNPRMFNQEGYTIMNPKIDPLKVFSQLGSRQQEVMKMAKSIFSKRTRTLYYWIYPTASKQQVKQIVSNTWDSMPPQEIGIYVAQVLAKFGYVNGDLMINPQLGHIKQLGTMNMDLHKFNSKAAELQSAISSITKKNGSIESFDAQPCKKSKNVKDAVLNVPLEFEDDPELSKELAQFSIMFKNDL